MTNIAVQNTNHLVEIKNNQVISNSHKVASQFGKRHDHVIRDIDVLIAGINEINASEGLPKIGDTPFKEVVVINQQNNQEYRSFDLTRDGFALLAMGYTGKEALKFKIQFINAFNAMQAQLAQKETLKLESQDILIKQLEGNVRGEKARYDVLRKEHNKLNDSLTQLILSGQAPLTPQQMQEMKDAVKTKASTIANGDKERGYQYSIKAAFQYIYNRIYKEFKVPNYSLISRGEFDAALRFVQKVTQSDFLKESPGAFIKKNNNTMQLDLFKTQVVVDLQESIELSKASNDPAIKHIIIGKIERSIDKLNSLGFNKAQQITIN